MKFPVQCECHTHTVPVFFRENFEVLSMTFVTVIVTFFAGMSAGLGTGFAGMSAAAVISPMLITFL